MCSSVLPVEMAKNLISVLFIFIGKIHEANGCNHKRSMHPMKGPTQISAMALLFIRVLLFPGHRWNGEMLPVKMNFQMQVQLTYLCGVIINPARKQIL